MAGSVNKVTLIGNLGRDPEVRSTQDGMKIVNLSLATSENWKDRNSVNGERTEWHRVVIFNENLRASPSSICARALKSTLRVSCKPANGPTKWPDRYTTEVVLQRYRGELTMLDGRGEGGGGYGGGGFNQDQGYGGGGGDMGGGGMGGARRLSADPPTWMMKSPSKSTRSAPGRPDLAWSRPYFDQNQAKWQELARVNPRSPEYSLAGLRAGTSRLHAIEASELGPVDGLDVLHLQCHFVVDSLILAQHGARVTALDLAPRPSPRRVRWRVNWGSTRDRRGHL